MISHSEHIGNTEYILPQGIKGKHRGRRRLSKPVLSEVEVSKPKAVFHGPCVHFDRSTLEELRPTCKLNVHSRTLPHSAITSNVHY